MAFNFLKFFQGLKIVPKNTSTADSRGELEVLDTDGKLRYHDGSSASPVVTEAHTATLTNKSINADQNTISNIDNNEIKALAGISVNKLEALDPNFTVITDGSGFITESTVTSAELAELSGVSDNIQDQLDEKLDQFASSNDNRIVRTDGGTGSAVQDSLVSIDDSGNVSGVVTLTSSGTITDTSLTTNKAVVTNSSKGIITSATTDVEIGYISGLSSSVQTQINSKVNKSGDTMTGDLSLGTHRITSLADPVSATDATNKQYVDALTQGLAIKASVKAATVANITLSGEQTIDGVLTSSSRVLVKNQSSPVNNGIYLSAAGAWTRTTDADLFSELVGSFVFVEVGGSINGGTGWACTSPSGGTIGVDPITFTQFSGAGTITTDGEGLQITGNQLSLELDGTTLSKSGSGLKVAALGVTNAEISVTAAIARTKIGTGTINQVVINDGSGALSSEAQLAKSRGGTGIDNTSVTFPSTGTILTADNTAILTNKTFDADGTGNSITNIENADIKASANIARTKLASGTNNHVVINDGSGVMSSEAQLALSRGGAAITNVQTNDNTTTGSSATLNAVTGHVRLTNGSLVSLAMIPAAASGGIQFTLYNDTGNSISILNDSGGTAANRIYTGTGADITLIAQASLLLKYDGTSARWLIIGGSGSGGSGGSGSIIKVRLLDVANTSLPTGTVAIDGESVVNGDLVLFTALLSGNNQVYQAAESLGVVSGWSVQSVFEGGSTTPSDLDIVGVKEGTYYADNLIIYQGTEFINLLNNKVESTLTDNTSNTTIIELDTDVYKFFVMEYSLERDGEVCSGEFWASSNGTITDYNDDRMTLTDDLGVSFDSNMNGTIMQIRYTTSSTGDDVTIKKTVRIW